MDIRVSRKERTTVKIPKSLAQKQDVWGNIHQKARKPNKQYEENKVYCSFTKDFGEQICSAASRKVRDTDNRTAALEFWVRMPHVTGDTIRIRRADAINGEKMLNVKNLR